MKRILFIAVAFLSVITISCFSGYMLNDKINASAKELELKKQQEEDKEREKMANIYRPSDSDFHKTTVADTIVNGVAKKNKLIITEVSLSCEVTIDESYLDWTILKKRQILNFYSTAMFYIDMENFTEEDIFLDNTQNILKIFTEKPKIVSINIDNSKTIINKMEKGALRFRDIKIAPEKFIEIQEKALSKMSDQLENDEIRALTESNTREALEELFRNILSETEFGIREIEIIFK